MISQIQDFEADFLWKVSLKILNSGMILKTFTLALQIEEYRHLKLSNIQCTYKHYQTAVIKVWSASTIFCGTSNWALIYFIY